MGHLTIEAFFKVRFPVGVKRVGFGLDFDMTDDGQGSQLKEADGLNSAVGMFEAAIEARLSGLFRTEVFGFEPAGVFARMTPSSPAP